MNHRLTGLNRRKYHALAVSLLTGGALLGSTSCGARVSDAVVQGTQTFLIGLLSPENFQIILDDGTGDGN